jgi:hypothetical protein
MFTPFVQLLELLAAITNEKYEPQPNWTFELASAALKQQNNLILKKVPVETTTELWKNIHSQIIKVSDSYSDSSFNFLFHLFELVRNLCPHSPQNQNQSCNIQIHKTSISILDKLHNLTQIEIKLTKIGIQMLSNIITDNPECQKIVFPILLSSSIVRKSVLLKDVHTSALILILNLISRNHRQSRELVLSENGRDVLLEVLRICESLVLDSENISFELCISIIASVIEVDSFSLLWDEADLEMRITLLKILDGVCHSKENVDGNPFVCLNHTLGFLIALFGEKVHSLDYDTVDDIVEWAKYLGYIIQYIKINTEGNIMDIKIYESNEIRISVASKIY